jgi:hypothetical protein
VDTSASQRLLERLCRRHGVPIATGARLRPLLERAVRSSLDVRRKLVAVVEATLRCEAETLRRREQLEQRYLIAVAAALHQW